jgi:hypothetical protein
MCLIGTREQLDKASEELVQESVEKSGKEQVDKDSTCTTPPLGKRSLRSDRCVATPSQPETAEKKTIQLRSRPVQVSSEGRGEGFQGPGGGSSKPLVVKAKYDKSGYTKDMVAAVSRSITVPVSKNDRCIHVQHT